MDDGTSKLKMRRIQQLDQARAELQAAVTSLDAQTEIYSRNPRI
jgi:hypothetical protein